MYLATSLSVISEFVCARWQNYNMVCDHVYMRGATIIMSSHWQPLLTFAQPKTEKEEQTAHPLSWHVQTITFWHVHYGSGAWVIPQCLHPLEVGPALDHSMSISPGVAIYTCTDALPNISKQ